MRVPLNISFKIKSLSDLFFVAQTCLLLCLLFSAGVQANSASDEPPRNLEELINNRPRILLELGDAVIEDFYREREYKPLWSGANGLHERAYDLLDVIVDSEDEGLRPSDYYLEEIQHYRETEAPGELARLDVLLSAAFYRYSNHLYSGRFEPADVDADWHIRNRRVDARKLFDRVANNDSIATLLGTLPPRHSGYRLLKQQLLRYRDIQRQGGWQVIAPGPSLEPGMQHPQVVQLRQRLHVTGDLDDTACCDIDIYDVALEAAVRRFQDRHGLAVDGRVGPQTRAALNTPVSEKIRLIRLNMERWRWMPRDLGSRYLVVNMSGFELYMVVNGSEVLNMPVIVGKAYRATPSFSGWLSYMEYNPYWTIPRKLVLEDIVPKQASNPSYLASRSIKVFSGWKEPQEIDPKTIDWDLVDRENFPYWMRQEPGPRNALGRVKFIFSNPHKVYLHGTPDKHLFNRVERAFSSGCIRVRDPVLLAAYLLDGGSLQKEEEVLAAIHLGGNERVDLPSAAPIYLVYWTAWVDEEGQMNFRHDIYNRDTRLRTLFDG